MYKLKNILSEIKVIHPSQLKVPDEWEELTDLSFYNDGSEIEMYGGKVISVWTAPMEGWDR